MRRLKIEFPQIPPVDVYSFLHSHMFVSYISVRLFIGFYYIYFVRLVNAQRSTI